MDLWAKCPACGIRNEVTQAGKMKRHKAATSRWSSTQCDGAGQPAVDLVASLAVQRGQRQSVVDAHPACLERLRAEYDRQVASAEKYHAEAVAEVAEIDKALAKFSKK